MTTTTVSRTRAFTLIELLVVVAIIALLLSILLPSLQCARDQAKAASCGVILRGFGTGLATYETENNGWFPGANTSGIATAQASADADRLRNDATLPVQTYDWMTPIIRYDTQLSGTRAERFAFLLETYACPAQEEVNDFPFRDGLARSADQADFGGRDYRAVSYMMPGHFQMWGMAWSGTTVAGGGQTGGGRPAPDILAYTPRRNWDLYHAGRYQSKIDLVGPPSRKVAICDATRFFGLDNGQPELDFNPEPFPSRPGGDPFGSFCCNSAWWSGAQAFGVKAGTANWNGRTVGRGSSSEGQGMRLSYRHGCGVKATLPQDVRSNKGSINALFFDGHVARLDDKASRNPELWYPSGAKVFNTTNGLIDLFDVGETLP